MANEFMRNLTLRQGSGLEMKADKTGGRHMLTAGMADHYAAAGQVMPANLRPAMAELDGLIAEEVALSKVSPQARYALAGSGYDPLSRKRRVTELEDFILTESADARTIGDRLKNQLMEVQVRQGEANVVATEQQNAMLAQTFDADVAAKRSGLQLQAATNRAGIQRLADAETDTAITKSAYQSGLNLNELYAIYESNDSEAMTKTFGTTDRMRINSTLMGMSTVQNKHNAEALEAMQGAVQASGMRLAGDAAITDEQLMAMAAGELPPPDGMSRLAVAQALEERQKVMASRAGLTTARTSGITAQAELNKLVYGSMTLQEKANTLAGMLGMDAVSVMQAIQAGQGDQLVAQAGKAADVQIADPTGQPFMAQGTALASALIADYNARAGQITHQLLASSALQRYEVQRKENLRALGMATAIMGQPAPPTVQNQVSTYVDQATAMWRQAVLPTTTPEQRGQLEEAAQQAFESARNVLAEYMKKSGVPASLVEDVKQGRITSQESYKQATVEAVGFGASRYQNKALGQAVENLLKSKGINSHDMTEFQKDPQATLLDLKHDRLIGANRIEAEDVTKMIDGVGRVYMTNMMLDTIMTHSWSQYLDKDMMRLLQPLLSGEAERETGMDPNEALRRTMLVARMIDEVAYMRSEASKRAGDMEAPTYSKGAIFSTFQHAVNDGSGLQDFFAPAGVPDRATAALLSEYNHIRTGQERAGEKAVSYDQIVPTAVRNMQTSIATSMAGHGLADLGAISANAKMNAFSWLTNGGATGVSFGDPQALHAQSLVEQAVLGIMAERAAGASTFTWFGLSDPVYSAATRHMQPTRAEIDQKLVAMGYDPEAIRATYATGAK